MRAAAVSTRQHHRAEGAVVLDAFERVDSERRESAPTSRRRPGDRDDASSRPRMCSPAEFKRAWFALGVRDLSDAQVKAVFAKVGHDARGNMPYDVFAQGARPKSGRVLGLEHIKKGPFEDADDARFMGKITYPQCRRACRRRATGSPPGAPSPRGPPPSRRSDSSLTSRTASPVAATWETVSCKPSPARSRTTSARWAWCTTRGCTRSGSSGGTRAWCVRSPRTPTVRPSPPGKTDTTRWRACGPPRDAGPTATCKSWRASSSLSVSAARSPVSRSRPTARTCSPWAATTSTPCSCGTGKDTREGILPHRSCPCPACKPPCPRCGARRLTLTGGSSRKSRKPCRNRRRRVRRSPPARRRSGRRRPSRLPRGARGTIRMAKRSVRPPRARSSSSPSAPSTSSCGVWTAPGGGAGGRCASTARRPSRRTRRRFCPAGTFWWARTTAASRCSTSISAR